MTDLISRAAAIDAIVFNSEDKFAIDVLNDVPAVDAVPVERLDWRIMNAKYNGIKEAADAFEFVLKCWNEEQEAR